MNDFLFSPEGRAYLDEHYNQKLLSTYAIARLRGTYANEVRRALLHHGFMLRTKSAAQKAAIVAGRTVPPNQRAKHAEEETVGISVTHHQLPGGGTRGSVVGPG